MDQIFLKKNKTKSSKCTSKKENIMLEKHLMCQLTITKWP
jgi:hypothetical protein